MKKFKAEKGVFQATTPGITNPAAGTDLEAAEDDITLITWNIFTQPRVKVAKKQMSKDRNRCRYKP